VKCEKKADVCDPCKVSILDKLRAKMHKNDCCEVVTQRALLKQLLRVPKNCQQVNLLVSFLCPLSQK
jgi:hypothetical protein